LLSTKKRITLFYVTTITCKIPERLDATLEAVAAKRKVSKSEIVREALEENLGNKAKISAYDLMKDACGIVKSGVRDLATNPKHLRDLGRE
jgi:metal-responsive CopG/Arc/MetJ family transcriptional regulator